jgi:hypothetical protein
VKSGKEIARFERNSLDESHHTALCQFTSDGKEVVV